MLYNNSSIRIYKSSAPSLMGANLLSDTKLQPMAGLRNGLAQGYSKAILNRISIHIHCYPKKGCWVACWVGHLLFCTLCQAYVFILLFSQQRWSSSRRRVRASPTPRQFPGQPLLVYMVLGTFIQVGADTPTGRSHWREIDYSNLGCFI